MKIQEQEFNERSSNDAYENNWSNDPQKENVPQSERYLLRE